MLKHLIDNAQEATSDDGYVHIELLNQGKDHLIQITDNGAGMTKDFIRDRLFKPFDTTKGNAGMGIGMYESRDFIQSLGGKIEVTSQVAHGTQIAVHIPVHQA
jgi:signal transduction histidine kinase